jgi:hypothetical protein
MLQLQRPLSAIVNRSGAPVLEYGQAKFDELHLLLIDNNWRFVDVDENPLLCLMLLRFLPSKNEESFTKSDYKSDRRNRLHKTEKGRF